MSIIAPSLLSADFMNLSRDLDTLIQSDVKILHLDVMDGHFVPNITFGPHLVKKISEKNNKKMILDTHLMLSKPMNFIEKYADAGSDYITVHVECSDDIEGCIEEIKKCGAVPGLSIKPGTPVSALMPYIGNIGLVLVMSVEPGFSGQKMIESCVGKISEIRALPGGDKVLVSVDGGVTVENTELVRQMGADWIVAGNAVFSGGKIEENFSRLTKIALR